MHMNSTTEADVEMLLSLAESRDLTQDDAAEIANAAQDQPEILRALIHNAQFWRDHSRNNQTKLIVANSFENLRRAELVRRLTMGINEEAARSETGRLSTFDLLYSHTEL